MKFRFILFTLLLSGICAFVFTAVQADSRVSDSGVEMPVPYHEQKSLERREEQESMLANSAEFAQEQREERLARTIERVQTSSNNNIVIVTDRQYSEIFGYYAEPISSVFIEHFRNQTLLTTYETMADQYGGFYIFNTNDLVGGDTLRIRNAGETHDRKIATLNFNYDVQTDTISGTLTDGHTLYVDHITYFDTQMILSCDFNLNSFSEITVGDNGQFSKALETDIIDGTTFYIGIQTPDGGTDVVRKALPIVGVNLDYRTVYGVWAPNSELTIKLTTPDGSVLETYETVSYDYAYGINFNTYFSQPLLHGYKIEVSDGQHTEIATVRDFPIDMKIGELFDGGSGYGRFTTLYSDNVENGSYHDLCGVAQASEGNFMYQFFDYDGTVDAPMVTAQDYAYVFNFDFTGNFTRKTDFPLNLAIIAHTGKVYGYSSEEAELVTTTLERDGSVLETAFSETDDYGSIEVALANPFIEGDIVTVAVENDETESVVIPRLEINPLRNNRIEVYGFENANLALSLLRYAQQGYPIGYHGTSVMTNENGRGVINTTNMSWYPDGSPIDLNHPCVTSQLNIYSPNMHQVYWQDSLTPTPIGPDMYETDNDFASATAFEDASQSHSFHSNTDRDYIELTISPEQVNQMMVLGTTQMGWEMGVKMDLYDATNGTPTLLFSELGFNYSTFDNMSNSVYSGMAVAKAWSPEKAGTYYLKFSPPNADSAAYCDAVYTFDVLDNHMFIPMIGTR